MNPILQQQVKDLLIAKGVEVTSELNNFIAVIDKEYANCDQDRIEFIDSVRILADAQSIANIGYWSVNMKTNQVTWSEGVFHIFDVDKTKFKPTVESFFQFVHPDDRVNVMKLWQENKSGRFNNDAEFRIVSQTGQVKWVQARTNRASIENIDVDQKIIGTFQDINDHKLIEEAMNDANKRLRLFFDNAPNGYLLLDENGVIISVNKEMEAMTMMTRAEMFGHKLGDLDIINRPEAIKKMLKANTDSREQRQELELTSKDGSVMYIDNRNSPFDIQGEKVILAMFSDITSRHQAEADMEKRAKRLERINKTMINRELKMIELKKENIDLRHQLELAQKNGH